VIKEPFSRRLFASLLNFSIASLGLLSMLLQLAARRLQWTRFRHLWLKPRPGDIYIATSPKAGTTWMQMIVYEIVTAGRGEFDHILQVSPFCENLAEKRDGWRILDSLASPRILKTHATHERLQPPVDSKVIYVSRNASDTLVSFYHHQCMALAAQLDFDRFFKETVDRGNSLFLSHLRSWWPHRSDPNVLHVRYEDLTTHLEREVRRVAQFCGIAIEESRLGEILEKCSFNYMKQNNDKFDFRLASYKSGPRGGFIRKGGVGGSRNQLSAAQQAALDQQLQKVRQQLGIPETEL
jgi:hypothetical protein